MKRILHISKYYYPFVGGIEQTARDCVRALSDLYEQKIICFNHEPEERLDIVDGVEVVRCKCFAKIASQSISLSYKEKLNSLFKEFAPDIVIFHYPNPFVAHWVLKYFPSKTRLVIYWHLDIVKQKVIGKFFVGQNKRLVCKAALLIATSPNYVDGSPYLNSTREKCVVVPSCINAKRLHLNREEKEISEKIRATYSNKIICVAVGRHTEYKGFRYLIEASKLLDDRFEIFIIGGGELTGELKKLAEDDNKIHFLGLISDSMLKVYLYAMDIFCFPSITRNEAFGLALAEALYYGKPAVTFTINGSGVNYVNINGLTGIEVPNRDVRAYADALKELADNPVLREVYGKCGKERVIQNFLDDKFEENIRRVIEEIR